MPEFISFAQILGFLYLQDDYQGEISAYFGEIADRLVSAIGPSSVLFIGTSGSMLLPVLEERGIAATGLALPGERLTDLPAGIREKYRLEPVGADPGRRFDLVLCLESLPKLDEVAAPKILQVLQELGEDILFSATPFPVVGLPQLTLHSPGYWAAAFAERGFVRDFSFDATFVSPWAMRFRKARPDSRQLFAAYATQLWEKEQEARTRRALLIEQHNELSLKEMEIQLVHRRVAEKEAVIQDILNSRSWRIMQKVQRIRLKIIPLGSRQESAVLTGLRGLRLLRNRGPKAFFSRLYEEIAYRIRLFFFRMRYRRQFAGQTFGVQSIEPRDSISVHRDSVEIIVCVHNALEDVQRCLDSVVMRTSKPYRLMLVDDGSDAPTAEYLRQLAEQESVTLLRNDRAQGYTRAANWGLKHSEADFVVLLNSDTIVTESWLDRLIACANSDEMIGLVGPLSNTASWQSIPEIENLGDWAQNILPTDVTIADMGRIVSKYAARLYPTMPFLNGFCLLIKRRLIEEIGYFDEGAFGAGYGEEDDYALRARAAGWQLALADDAYVYHAQSRSYSDQRRKQLSARAGTILAEKHSQRTIDKGIGYCLSSPVLSGIRARSRVMFERQHLIQEGRARFAGKSIGFVLPIKVAGGGGNVVITEAHAMQEMGVEVSLINLKAHQRAFENAHPFLDIPVHYTQIEDLPMFARRFDAVVATFNPSVHWLSSSDSSLGKPVFGYYIQGFEPLMYPEDPEGFRVAWDSYTVIPGMVRFAKTEWTSHQVRQQIGVDCAVVGCSVDLDLFRPRPPAGPDWPERPLRVTAMIRPNSPYRAPRETMEILREASRKYATKLEVVLFGVEPDDPEFVALPHDFQWRSAGTLSSFQIASLLNEIDIFLDYSSHQAMGLTALEAMACGAAVVLPVTGGAIEFARHEENSLVIDTTSAEARWEALKRLIEDHELRRVLQQNALRDACGYYPEGPAYRTLDILLGGPD